MSPSGPFNFKSSRAQQARLGRVIAHGLGNTLLIISCVLLVGGGLGVVFALHMAWGWIVAGLAAPFLMLVVWADEALRTIPMQPRSQNMEDLLESSLLGQLPADPTPQQLAHAALQVSSGQFVAVRFGFGADFLPTIVSQEARDTAAVWQDALRLREQTGSIDVDGSILVVALIRSMSDLDSYLARLRLTRDDLVVGATWYQELQSVIAKHGASKQDGGIGRDWSFGYTPLLSQFAFNVSEHVTYNGVLTRAVPTHEQAMQQVMTLLSQGGRRNAALVGALGAGKTALVRALAKRLLEASPDVPKNLHFRQIIALDPASLIAKARGRGELEELVTSLCYEALAARNTILFLDDAQLFFEEGSGAVNLSNILLPVLEGGGLPIILAMDEQRRLRISQNNPALAQLMNRVILKPTDKQETMFIMQNQFVLMEYENKVTYTYQSLDATYRLSERYIPDQVMPGRALKLLEAAAGFAEQGLVTHRSVEQAIEQTQGIKVGSADTGAERETLLNLEALIHARMINQTRAVRVVSDALRRARAGVRNSSRPIGTFLFLGPTGVGKTELAKSVAAVFFGDEDHLIRLDLNEYVRSEDVTRLIADGAQDPHSLTAQIAKQPFSVVLLDEIEKAHPNVLNTLLQLLDEGILRDINNREVSFRDAVIIATSNAGAERIRQHIEAGEQLEQFEEQFTNELISANIFRPEFLNRFDEMVLFRSLNIEELGQVVDLILQGVNKELAVQKISVSVDDDAKKLLVQAGYDPRLGARPMRRVVQRVVENIVANRVLAQQTTPGEEIHVTSADVQTMLNRS